MNAILVDIIRVITRTVELGGVAVIVIGALGSTFTLLRRLQASSDRDAAIRGYRTGLGHAILLGLELLVAADIINTVAIEPTLNSVMVLGGIVLIRTFLSFSLQIEIEHRWPWERGKGNEEHRSPRNPSPKSG
jgi:uncharacterized membrane protein